MTFPIACMSYQTIMVIIMEICVMIINFILACFSVHAVAESKDEVNNLSGG